MPACKTVRVHAMGKVSEVTRTTIRFSKQKYQELLPRIKQNIQDYSEVNTVY